MTKAILIAIAVVGCLLGCGPENGLAGGGSDPTPTPTSAENYRIPPLDLASVGRPKDKVTDSASFELTPKQAEKIREKCFQQAGIPGTGKDCEIPSLGTLPRCRRVSIRCFDIFVTNHDAGIIRVRDQKISRDSCTTNSVNLCTGVVVKAKSLKTLIAEADPSPTSTTSSPEPTVTTSSTEPTAPTTEPTAPPTEEPTLAPTP